MKDTRKTECNEEISRKNEIRDFQRINFITSPEIEEKLKNDIGDGQPALHL